MPPTSSNIVNDKTAVVVGKMTPAEITMQIKKTLGLSDFFTPKNIFKKPAAPIKARKPVRKPSPFAVVEDTVVYTQKLVPLEIKGEDGEVVRTSKVDLRITQRKIDSQFHHHEYVVVDCFTGEVYTQLLNQETYEEVMESEKHDLSTPRNLLAYSKEIKPLLNMTTMSVTYVDDDSILVNTFRKRPEYAPRVPLVKLTGEDFADFTREVLEMERRERWNEMRLEKFTREITEACMKEKSYIDPLQRELTMTKTTLRDR